MNDAYLIDVGDLITDKSVDVGVYTSGAPLCRHLSDHAEGDTGDAIQDNDEVLHYATAFGYGGEFVSRRHLPDGRKVVLRTCASRATTTMEVVV